MRNVVLLLMAFAALELFGCSRTITSENPNGPNREQISSFTPEDIEAAVGEWMKEIDAFGPIADNKDSKPPLVGYSPIVNRTKDPDLDMTEFERAFKFWAVRTKKIRFTSAMSLPDNFFEQHKFQRSVVADSSSAAQLGKFAGWKYTIYGDMFETRALNAKKERITYYNVYVRMLDIGSGEEVWNARKQFKLRDKRAGLGWR